MSRIFLHILFYNHFMNKFAERLRELRTEKGLRLIDVGNAVGITLRAVCNYESGAREPSLDTLILLCKFFEVTADYLLGLSDSY